MAHSLQQHSPFACRWIQGAADRDVRASNWTRALCVRVASAPRSVTREECARCQLWEPRPEDISRN